MIPISKPYLPALRNAIDVINSGWISSSVPEKYSYIVKTTKLLQDMTGNLVLLTNNGTSATHLTVKCLRQFYPNVKLIFTSNNSYVAAWNSILFENYHIPIPIDANIHTWNMDLDLLIAALFRNQSRSAVQYVHNLGNIIPILDLNCPIIEDNCEGFYSGYSKSNLSLCASISFFGNKLYTSGEGGAFLTDREDVFDFARQTAYQGQTDKKFIHDKLGFNYRMTNVQAAILYDSLQLLETIEGERQRVWNTYMDCLKDYDIQKIPYKHSHWHFAVRIPGNTSYDIIEKYMNDAGIEVRPMFYPFSRHKHLSKYAGQEKIATILNNECVVLPTYPDLKDEQIIYISTILKRYINDKVL